MTAAKPEDRRTYEITFEDRGPMRITIPATWKVTYGAVVPTDKGMSRGFGLRIWETGDKQRAVWANVKSFRDLSIETQIAAVRKYGTAEWWADDGETWSKPEYEAQVEQSWQPEAEVKIGTPPWFAAMTEGTTDHAPWDEAPRAMAAKTGRAW